ncbi:MAG: hypothetical protein AAFR93_07345 [Pseudomonadota bacterium]
MKHFVLAALAISLAACAAPEMGKEMSEDGFTRLATVEDLGTFLDRNLAFDAEQYSVINSDGSLGGIFAGVGIEGTWEMEDGFFCRTLTAGPEYAMKIPVDCQLLEANGSTLRGTRDKGNGRQFILTAQ